MSAMDKAFIKAYGKSAWSEATQRSAAQTVVSAPTPTIQRADPPRSTRTFVPLATWTPEPSVIPAPHLKLKPRSQGGEEAPAATVPQSIETVSPSAIAAEPASAAFEVAQFNWPAIVDRITTAAASGFTALSTLIAERAREQRKVLAVASLRRGEGRSTLAMAVARWVGSRNIRVALIDADFQRPRLGEHLQVVTHAGWDDTLAGEQPLSEALIESIADRVTLLPLRSAIAGPLGNQQRFIAETIDHLRKTCDLIVIDLGPLDDDATAIDFGAAFRGTQIDDALVVRDIGRTSLEEVKLVGNRLAAAGVGHWDVVENFVGTVT